jgi:hypothetical protein
MSHVLRPSSEKTFNIADALAGIPRCILTLETAIVDLAADFRDDAKRSCTRELIRALSAGCPECGFKASSGTLRMIEGLVALKPDSATGLSRSLTDRLLELIAILKAQAQENRRA